MSANTEEKTAYKVYQTVLEMLQDRGWESPELPDSDNFRVRFNSKNLDIYIENTEMGAIYIHFNTDTKSLGKTPFINVVQKIKEKSEKEGRTTIPNIIIITREKVSSSIGKLVNEERDKYQGIEFFLFDELFFNVTHYEDNPQFRLLSVDEKKQIQDKYGLRDTQFKKILKTDPVSRYYGANTGQVFEIIRTSVTAGETYDYRIVR